MESLKLFPPLSWLGLVFFLLGMAINVQSDSVLRRLLLLMMNSIVIMVIYVNNDVDGDYPHSDSILASLRAPGETGYKIPHGGLFCLLSAPNYFGETLEWCGFAAFAQVAFHLLGCLLAPCTVWESTIYGISLRSKQFRTQITIKESWECFLACIISIFLRPQLLSGLLLGIFSSLGTELSRPTLGISTSLEENILLAEKLSFPTYCDPRIETQC